MKIPGKISVIQRLFNVNRGEWSRLVQGWLLKFFYQVSYVLGWTLITAMVVTQFGIEGLPFFYILNASLIILGTLIFSYILEFVSQKKLLMMTSASLGVLLLIGASLYGHNHMAFVATLVLGISAFSSQLNILLLGYIEELFSPLENERVIPLIETAEPLGGVVAGLLLVSTVQYIAPQNIVYIWALFAFMLFPALALFSYTKHHKTLKLVHRKQKKEHSYMNFRKGVSYVKALPFVKLLLVVILLQWTFVHVLEYQYTRALNDSLGGHHGVAESHGEHGDYGYSEESSHGHSQAAIAHEAELTHGLGTLHLFFSLVMFIVQLFLSSRIVRKVGVVRAMMLMPLLNLCTSVGMAFRFALPQAVLAKGAYEGSLVVYNNGYHNSYYAMYEHMREYLRELLEGAVRPVGVIVGMLAIIALQFLVPSDMVPFYLSILMIGISLAMLGLLVYMRSHYTQLSKKKLEYPGVHPEKYNAIEILTQKGHRDAAEILSKSLIYKNEPPEVKIQILQSLGQVGDPDALPEILQCLADPNQHVRIAACEAIGAFKNLGEKFYNQAFSKHRVISALKALFYEDPSRGVKSAIVQAFASINHPEVVDLLLEALEDAQDELKADIIHILGMFHDVNTGFYLEKYLIHSNAKVRSNAIMALWQFKKYRLKLLAPLIGMLESGDRDMKLSGIYTLGEIEAVQEIPRLLKYMAEGDLDMRRHAAIALGKLDHEHAIGPLVELLLHPDKVTAVKTFQMMKRIHGKTKKLVKTILLEEITYILHDRFGISKSVVLEDLPREIVEELMYYYEILGEEGGVARMRHYLDSLDVVELESRVCTQAQ